MQVSILSDIKSQQGEKMNAPNIPAPIPLQDFYAVFSGPIDPNSTQKFFNNFSVITQQKQQDKRLHLLLQSMGGSIGDGIALYNLLKSAPLEVFLYNGGGVQSIAAVCFLAGKHRIASRYATFMLHRSTCAAQPMTVPKLTSVLSSLKIDDDRTDAILRAHLNFSDDQWAHLRNNEFWLTADDALKSGLITAIGEFAPPKDAPLRSFNL